MSCSQELKISNLDNYNKYKEYILALVGDGMSDEDILSSASDERIIYNIYFALDENLDNFEQITKSILDSTK